MKAVQHALTLFSLLIMTVTTGAIMGTSNAYACETSPMSWSQFSSAKNFHATIYPKDTAYKIGQPHQWVLELKDSAGQPVAGAEVSLRGDMHGHGHGMPAQPMVESYLGNGKYLIDDVVFNMIGHWTLLLTINTHTNQDNAQFDLHLGVHSH